MGFGVSGSGFHDDTLEMMNSGFGFGVAGGGGAAHSERRRTQLDFSVFVFRIWGLGFRFRVSRLWFRVSGDQHLAGGRGAAEDNRAVGLEKRV